jgi:hypothetical protein
MWQSSPFLINKGPPSTDLKARTGEFTPPGKYVFAVSKRESEAVLFIPSIVCVFIKNRWREDNKLVSLVHSHEIKKTR